jgi:hypothetical protein
MVDAFLLCESSIVYCIGVRVSVFLSCLPVSVSGLAAAVCVVLISHSQMTRPQELVSNSIRTRDGTIDLNLDEKVQTPFPKYLLTFRSQIVMNVSQYNTQMHSKGPKARARKTKAF